MTSLQMNAELFRQLSLIAQDETLMTKAIKALKRITAKHSDPAALTKDEFEQKLNRAEEQIERGECLAFSDRQSMNAWLNAL